MEKVLMKGNEAMAEGAIRANCRYFFGYPITPQNEVPAYFAKRMPQVSGVYLQAESELAAINMVLGAASTGARVMTSSSSPGISLKTEGISYIAACDLPCVIANVQRGGPGLGGIQPSQADYWQATKAPGHGDLHIIVLAPSSVSEMADLCMDAFDLADLYRIPVMILSDGILGQMMEPIEFKERNPIDLPKKDWATTGTKGKRPHNVINSLYLQPEVLERLVFERFKKYEIIKEKETRAEEMLTADAQIVIVAYGASARVAKSAIKIARERGIKVGLVRPVTLWPFPDKILKEAAKTAKHFIDVEMSMGQMIDDVRLAIECSRPVSLVNTTGGMIPTISQVLKEIERVWGGVK